MSKLKIEIVEGVEGLTSLRAEWQNLLSSTGAPPFLGWDWLSMWRQWFGAKISPFIVCVRERDLLVGILALGLEMKETLPFGPPIRKLSFLGERFGGADYLDILALPGYEQDCAIAIFEFLSESKAFDLLLLDGLPTDSATLPLLSRHFGEKDDYVYRLSPRYVCPHVKIGTGWEEVLQRSGRADNYKRKLRKLRAHSGFEYRTVTCPDEIPAAFDRFIGLHESCWSHRGGSGATGTDVSRGFQREVVVQLARQNLVRFDELWVENGCRASIYGLENGQTYYFFLSGYDMDWSNQSVGLTLLGLSIENACSRGVLLYDFLRGVEAYKFEWATCSRMTALAQIANNSMTARWALGWEYAIEALRAWTPQNVKTKTRTWRHILRTL